MKLELRMHSCKYMCLENFNVVDKVIAESGSSAALSSDQRVLKAAAEAIGTVQQEREELAPFLS